MVAEARVVFAELADYSDCRNEAEVRKMSALKEIKSLEAQKRKLLTKAKAECLKKIAPVLLELKELGFEFKLVEKSSVIEAPTKKTKSPKGNKPTKKRRSGFPEKVLKTIAATEKGLARKQIDSAHKVASQSDKRAISNALTALKRNNFVTLNGGVYRAAS